MNIRPGYAAAERGGLLGSQGRYEEALVAYTQAIAADPDYLEAYNDRGLTYTKVGKYQQALADFNRAIALGARLTAYARRGSTYLALGEYQQALADFNRFIEESDERQLKDMSGSARIGRSRAYVGLGDYRRGVADLTRALELVSDRYLAQQAHYYRGCAYAAQRKFREALADFDMAIAIEPFFDDTDTRLQHENAIRDLRHRRDEAYRATISHKAPGTSTDVESQAQRGGWLSRLIGRSRG